MKKSKLGLLSLIVIAVCILLASCDNFIVPETKGETSRAYNNNALSRKIELAMWHTAENYETSVETLQGHIQALLQPDINTESRSRSSVTSVYSYSVTVENGFSSLPVNRRHPNAAPERSVIPFYVFQLENREEGTSGFAFTCGDPREKSVFISPNNKTLT